MVSERTFQIQLEGLIQLLAQSLYADPDVFLREMIQNAHDSIRRRTALAAERGETDLPPARIQVAIDRAARTIAIHDNGSGLSTDEIDDYLSTIGRSGTAELRQHILDADRSRTVELIGQFGIGLLSAFIVAEQVTIVTRRAGHEALRWESRGGGTYRVDPADRPEIGTTVTLHLRSGHDQYLDRERLQTIVRTYADFIGMPVYLDDDAEPANAVSAPWHRTYPTDVERLTAHNAFWQRRFLRELSLYMFVVDEAFEWVDLTEPDGRRQGRVRGVLAISDRRIPDVNARGTVDVYINRMFVAAASRDVLPPWAKFLQGVVECNELTPNAARDNVVRNAALAAVQQALGRLIVAELTRLSERDRRRFVEVMRWHSYHILAMAVQDEHEEFFRAVADLMPLETDQGPVTLGEYLESGQPQTVHYITEQGSANQYFLLAGARGIRVFDCSEPFAETFLNRYARTWPERIQPRRLDLAGSETIFEPLDDAEAERFADLRAACSRAFPDKRCVAEVSRFRPVEVPAVLTETSDRRSRRDLETAAGHMALPGYIRDLVSGFLTEQPEPLTLHLNADNPTVRKLAARANPHDEVSQDAIVSLYNNALMLLARTLPVDAVQGMFAQYNTVIERMLTLAEERTGIELTLAVREAELDQLRTGSGDLDPYVSCLVAAPSGDPRAEEIYRSVHDVLEDPPLHWRVVRAPDRRAGAHCFVAILAGGLDPHVLIEIGRMQALGRPVLLLHDCEAVDLPGVRAERVTATGAELVTEIRAAIGRHDELRALGGRDRFLSERTLSRHGGLNEQVSREISRRYPTWRTFLAADSATIGRSVNLNPAIVDGVKATLTPLYRADG